MEAPTYTLPACPVCSSVVRLERPVWKCAKATTQKRGRGCYIWKGCKHAEATVAPDKIRDDPKDWALCEAAWLDETRREFEARTESWTVGARADFARALEGKFELTGMTASLELKEPTS